MKKLLSVLLTIIIVATLVLANASVILAADTYKYYANIIVTDTTGTNRVNVPVILNMKGSTLIASGYLSADGLDMRITEGNTVVPFMSNTENLSLLIPSLSAYQTKTLTIYTGYSSDISNFYIIPGTGGYITITDDDALELGNNFEIVQGGYINSANGVDKNLLYKEEAIKTYISGNNSITSSIIGGENVTETGTTGYHTIASYKSGSGSAYYGNPSSSIPDYSDSTLPMSGSGTIGSPYIIHDIADLQTINNDLDAYYELGNDIDASDTLTWNSGKGFIPVGKANDNTYIGDFDGSLDGRGYGVYNLYMARPSDDGVGLFGFCHGTIHDLILDTPDITGHDSVGLLIGNSRNSNVSNVDIINGNLTITNPAGNAGGFAGFSYGGTDVFTDCSISITINTLCGTYEDEGFTYYHLAENIGGFIGYKDASGTISFTNCIVSYGEIYGYVNHVGGFAGRIEGVADFTKCAINGSIDVDSNGDSNLFPEEFYIGGFVGVAGLVDGDIVFTNCYAIPSILNHAQGYVDTSIAGFIGYTGSDNLEFVYNYSSAIIDAHASSGGSFFGYGFGGDGNGTYHPTVTNCYFDYEMATSSEGFGIPKTTIQMEVVETFVNWDFVTIWSVTEDPVLGQPCNGYPYLLNFVNTGTDNLLAIQVDSEIPVIIVSNTPVVDTEHDYILNQGNVTDAILYFSLSVGGVEKLRYYPATIISNTTIKDVVGSYDGVMTWGSNYGLTVTVEAFNSFIPSTPTSGTGSTTLLGADEPSHWYEHDEALSNMPIFDKVDEVATQMGADTLTLYLWFGLAFATVCGFGALLFTGSVTVAVVAMMTVMYALYNANILPGLAFGLAILISLCVIYVARQA